MATHLHTAWQGMDLRILRDEREIDRVAAAAIERVILVHRHGGDTPGDLAYALLQTTTDFLLLPPESGIAGRVHFERQHFWAQHACIYWLRQADAKLPARLRSPWSFWRSAPRDYQRVPRAELEARISGWPIEGPQTWEQRKWKRIVQARMLPPAVKAVK